jgi:hypothetical protein
MMRPWDLESVRILHDAHLEALRGGKRRPAFRRVPRRN